MAGLLDSLMAFDFAKAVIDNEIAMMLKRFKQGFEFSEENLALDLIAEVGSGGMFAATEHTLERMRTTMYLADVADRDPRQLWADRGSLDSQARALKIAQQILTRDNPAAFSPEVDARIRAEFEGMVAGDSVPPEGWRRASRPAAPVDEDGRDARRRRRHLRATVG
jgi:trimethylamine--corrinoid protein Co-methyltransferase